jgi:hypothetical protein
MLQNDRPDFVELDYIFRDVMRMDDCSHYLSTLMSGDKPQLKYRSLHAYESNEQYTQRFTPSQIKLTCPLHDTQFKYFSPTAQNYLCQVCVLERNSVDPDWLDLEKSSEAVLKRLKVRED